MYADRKLSERSWSLLIGKLEELDYFCGTMLNDFVDEDSTQHISWRSIEAFVQSGSDSALLQCNDSFGFSFFVMWLYLSVDCYIVKIKIIYCQNLRFFSHRILIQAYFQNNCYRTVLHISDSPAYELFTKYRWKPQSHKRQLSLKYQTSNLEAFHAVFGTTKDVSFSLRVDVYWWARSRLINNFVSTK